jgi:excisionase family DNA binding protein
VTRLLTVDDVAERLGVTKDWVWAQARAGRIPHVQLGRYRRFREEALEEWLDELERRSVDGAQISAYRLGPAWECPVDGRLAEGRAGVIQT